MGMELQDAAALQELSHRNGERWGTNTALWVIAAVVVIAFVANIWSRNCSEKVAFATGLANLDGRINCITPQVQTLNSQMYGAAQTFAGLVVGVNDMKESNQIQFGQLNNTVFYNPINNGYSRCGTNRSSCCGSPSRVFAQTQTFTPSTNEVTVTETCGNDRC
jgi:hypothetical protein|nr:MAG TPA: hypothetical protein [Caudoviricetes sp.]